MANNGNNGFGNGPGNGFGSQTETGTEAQGFGGNGHGGQGPQGDITELINELPTEELSQTESDSIETMLSGQKLAKDVYAALAELYDMDVLEAMAQAQELQLDLIETVAQKYGFDTTEATLENGIFADAVYQELYDQLVEQGSQDAQAALEVIALIEEMGLDTLSEYIQDIDNQDLSFVYDKLEKSGEQELSAAVKLLEDMDVEYVPQELTQDELDAILENAPEGKGPGGGHGHGGMDIADVINDLPTEDLSDAETSGITTMISEEKLARDVYSALAEQYDAGIFDMLESKEEGDLDAVTTLAEKYGLDTSEADLDQGVFTNEAFQNLYNELVSQALENEEAALETVALIEEGDIAELMEYADEADNQDVSLVFSMLQHGSEHQLQAAVNLLESMDVEYVPQELTQDQFDAIMEDAFGGHGGNAGGSCLDLGA